MQVTIVIPNYNGRHFLEMCLPSLQKQTFRDFRTVVVDNCSTDDDSLEYLEQFKGQLDTDLPLVVLPMDSNYGFSRAVNEGIRYAEKTDSAYTLLLNNDTVCDPDFVKELVAGISRSKKAFSCASRMIRMYEPDKLDSAGDQYTLLGWAYNRGGGRAHDTFMKQEPVFSACAGAALYRTDLFRKLGYFDESHFAYLEDLDVCYRARIKGYQNLYIPTAVVYHAGSGTTGSKYNAFKVRLAARNNIYLLYKNMPGLQLVLNAPGLILGMLIKTIFFSVKGLGIPYLMGIRQGLSSCRTLQKVPYESRDLLSYLRIEWELLCNTFAYAGGWLSRAAEQKKKS